MNEGPEIKCPVGLHECAIRARTRQIGHDLNNLLALFIGSVEGDCCHKEVLIAGERMLALTQGLVGLTADESVESLYCSVGDLATQWEVLGEALGLPWEVFFHDHLKEAERDLRVLMFPDADTVIQDNLMGNWTKAGITELHVTIYVDSHDRKLVIEMSDNGSGMSPDELEKLRTGPMTGEGEKGKGCQIIRRACALSGKTVSWESIEHVGTKITIRHQLLFESDSGPPPSGTG